MSSDKRHTYIIDFRQSGSDKASFYQHIQCLLCPEFKEFGCNLDALVDVLRGGFDKHDYGDDVTVIIRHKKDGIKALGEKFVKDVLECCDDAENVTWHEE